MTFGQRIIKAWDVLTSPEATEPSLNPEVIEPVSIGSVWNESPKQAPSDYAVTGTPRHIPWSRRKKELEQEARQKRRQRDEFRSQA